MYQYKAKGKHGLEQYSGKFNSKNEALAWYKKHGTFLKNALKRELVLIKD